MICVSVQAVLVASSAGRGEAGKRVESKSPCEIPHLLQRPRETGGEKSVTSWQHS